MNKNRIRKLLKYYNDDASCIRDDMLEDYLKVFKTSLKYSSFKLNRCFYKLFIQFKKQVGIHGI